MNEVRTLAKQTAVYGFGTIVPRFLNYGVMAIFYTRIFRRLNMVLSQNYMPGWPFCL